MDKLTALSLSIGLLSGVATFLAVGPAAGVFFIWAATIAWAAYFLLGANQEAVINTIVNGVFGVFVAWLTALVLIEIDPNVAPGFEVLAAVTVGVAVVFLVLGAKLPAFAVIPVGVLGYSSTFAYLLQTPNTLTEAVLVSPTLTNPLLVISISFIIGSVFGHLSAQLAGKFTKK